ncbi:reverse transcriptase, partial [Tanacetum coccineum]
MWDVHVATGRYLSTDFIVSDIKGNAMHCTAKGNITHNFLRLKEGSIYSVKNFTVVPNKDEFCVIRFSDFMLEFDGETTVHKSFRKSDGFTCYPFQSVEIDELEPTNNKYLIDVVGYVTNVGRITQTRTGSKTLDFYMANCSTSSTLIVDDAKIPLLMRLKTDDRRVPIIQLLLNYSDLQTLAMFMYYSGVALTKEILPVDNTTPKVVTL